MSENIKTSRGIVICPRFSVSGRDIELNCDVKPEDLRRYLLYWDKIGYAFPNGLGKPNLYALNDLRYLSEVGVLFEYDIPVSTKEIGKEEVSSPVPMAKAPYLFSSENPTVENPSGLIILGTPANIWPELSTYAQLEAATNVAPSFGELWTVGGCNSQLSTTKWRTSVNQLIEATLFASLPVPMQDTPLDELMEFREERRLEILQFRRAIDLLRSEVLSQPDSMAAIVHAKDELEIALIQIQRTLAERGVKTFLSTLRLYMSIPESSIVRTLLTTIGAAGAGLPLEVAAAAGIGVNTLLTFAERHFEVSRGLPSELNDFAYIYDVTERWPINGT